MKPLLHLCYLLLIACSIASWNERPSAALEALAWIYLYVDRFWPRFS